MKKLIIFLPILFIVTLVFPNNLSFFSHAEKVNKEISLSIFSGSNYGAAAYDDADATITVTISKINGDKKVVLDKQSYAAMQLKQFPSAAHAISKKMNISNMVGNSEILMVTYTVSYSSNGSTIIFENNQIVNKETAKENITISI